jgi:hypothetical protein
MSPTSKKVTLGKASQQATLNNTNPSIPKYRPAEKRRRRQSVCCLHDGILSGVALHVPSRAAPLTAHRPPPTASIFCLRLSLPTLPQGSEFSSLLLRGCLGSQSKGNGRKNRRAGERAAGITCIDEHAWCSKPGVEEQEADESFDPVRRRPPCRGGATPDAGPDPRPWVLAENGKESQKNNTKNGRAGRRQAAATAAAGGARQGESLAGWAC